MRKLVILVVVSIAGCGPKLAPNDAGEPASRVRLDDVRQIVARQFGLDVSKVDVNRPLMEYGDELDLVELVMELEDEHDVTIPDESLMEKGDVGAAGKPKDVTTADLAEIVRQQLRRQLGFFGVLAYRVIMFNSYGLIDIPILVREMHSASHNYILTI